VLKPVDDVQIILSPEQLTSPREDLKIVGTFNPGVTTIEEEGLEKTLLMVRIAVQKKTEKPGKISAPYFIVKNEDSSPFNITFDENDQSNLKKVNKKDIQLADGRWRLRHTSYQIVCVIDKKGKMERISEPIFYPQYEHERFGVEDCRITRMDEEIRFNGESYKYIITYVPPHRETRVGTAFALTNDFRKFKRIKPSPEDTPRTIITEKDISFFPRKIKMVDIDGKQISKFAALSRPSSFRTISSPDMTFRYSTKLLEWGPDYSLVESVNGGASGPGPAPVFLDEECLWLVGYHTIEETPEGPVYRANLIGLDEEKPWEVRYRSVPFIQPNEHNRKDKAYVPNVFYIMGLELKHGGDLIEIIGGENDESISRRIYNRKDLVGFLTSQ